MKKALLISILFCVVGCSSNTIRFSENKKSAAYLTPKHEIVMVNCFNHPESSNVILTKPNKAISYIMTATEITEAECIELGYEKIAFASHKTDKSIYPRFDYVKKRIKGKVFEEHFYVFDLYTSESEMKEIAIHSGEESNFPIPPMKGTARGVHGTAVVLYGSIIVGIAVAAVLFGGGGGGHPFKILD